MNYDQAIALKKSDKVHYHKDTEHLPAIVVAVAKTAWRRECSVSIVIQVHRRHVTVPTAELLHLHIPSDCAQSRVPPPSTTEVIGLFGSK